VVYLIDIDGTLLLSGGAGFTALDRAFERLHGVTGAMRTVRPAGKTDPCIVAEGFWTALGREPEPAELDAVLRVYLEHLPGALAEASRFRVLPGAREGLDALTAAGHLLCVATGNIRAAARLKLGHAALGGYFAAGGYGDDSADRAALVAVAARRAAAHLGRPLASGEVVVVGDTPRDVRAARDNGFFSVAVASGTVARPELEASAPDRLVTRLDEL
jgi:phosphoglycolate phosphatase-like HAD superfamily hydrolase